MLSSKGILLNLISKLSKKKVKIEAKSAFGKGKKIEIKILFKIIPAKEASTCFFGAQGYFIFPKETP